MEDFVSLIEKLSLSQVELVVKTIKGKLTESEVLELIPVCRLNQHTNISLSKKNALVSLIIHDFDALFSALENVRSDTNNSLIVNFARHKKLTESDPAPGTPAATTTRGGRRRKRLKPASPTASLEDGVPIHLSETEIATDQDLVVDSWIRLNIHTIFENVLKRAKDGNPKLVSDLLEQLAAYSHANEYRLLLPSDVTSKEDDQILEKLDQLKTFVLKAAKKNPSSASKATSQPTSSSSSGVDHSNEWVVDEGKLLLHSCQCVDVLLGRFRALNYAKALLYETLLSNCFDHKKIKKKFSLSFIDTFLAGMISAIVLPDENKAGSNNNSVTRMTKQQEQVYESFLDSFITSDLLGFLFSYYYAPPEEKSPSFFPVASLRALMLSRKMIARVSKVLTWKTHLACCMKITDETAAEDFFSVLTVFIQRGAIPGALILDAVNSLLIPSSKEINQSHVRKTLSLLLACPAQSNMDGGGMKECVSAIISFIENEKIDFVHRCFALQVVVEMMEAIRNETCLTPETKQVVNDVAKQSDYDIFYEALVRKSHAFANACVSLYYQSGAVSSRLLFKDVSFGKDENNLNGFLSSLFRDAFLCIYDVDVLCVGYFSGSSSWLAGQAYDDTKEEVELKKWIPQLLRACGFLRVEVEKNNLFYAEYVLNIINHKLYRALKDEAVVNDKLRPFCVLILVKMAHTVLDHVEFSKLQRSTNGPITPYDGEEFEYVKLKPKPIDEQTNGGADEVFYPANVGNVDVFEDYFSIASFVLKWLKKRRASLRAFLIETLFHNVGDKHGGAVNALLNGPEVMYSNQATFLECVELLLPSSTSVRDEVLKNEDVLNQLFVNRTECETHCWGFGENEELLDLFSMIGANKIDVLGRIYFTVVESVNFESLDDHRPNLTFEATDSQFYHDSSLLVPSFTSLDKFTFLLKWFDEDYVPSGESKQQKSFHEFKAIKAAIAEVFSRLMLEAGDLPIYGQTKDSPVVLPMLRVLRLLLLRDDGKGLYLTDLILRKKHSTKEEVEEFKTAFLLMGAGSAFLASFLQFSNLPHVFYSKFSGNTLILWFECFAISGAMEFLTREYAFDFYLPLISFTEIVSDFAMLCMDLADGIIHTSAFVEFFGSYLNELETSLSQFGMLMNYEALHFGDEMLGLIAGGIHTKLVCNRTQDGEGVTKVCVMCVEKMQHYLKLLLPRMKTLPHKEAIAITTTLLNCVTTYSLSQVEYKKW